LGWIGVPAMVYMLAAPALVISLHYDNIGRLLSGTERKIGQKVKVEGSAAPPSTNATPNVKA